MRRPESHTLADLIEELAALHPDKAAVTDARETLSFGVFRTRVLQVAKALYAEGVRSQDRVGILMGNRNEWLVVNFAIQYLGATMVALNTWYTDRELSYVVGHADINVLFMADRFLKSDYVETFSRFAPWRDEFPLLRAIIVLGERVGEGMIAYEDFVSRGAAADEGEVHALRQTVSSDDIAYQLYTSGSTAHPKGVLLQHRGLLRNTWNIGERLHYDESDVLYLPISLFWGLGCENAVPTAWQRAMHIVLQDHFDADEAMDLIETHRCTAMCGTANIMLAILNHPDRSARDLSSLRKGSCGASPDVSRRVIGELIPGLCHPFGLTETYGYSAVNDADDPVEKRATSDGRPMPETEFWIVSPETEERLGPGEIGEIRQRGLVLAGYYKAPEITAQSFDARGFFKTGDLGMIDEDGYLFFKGRSKEMIKTGGMNVSPAEVEGVLKGHPAVEDAFVTSLRDPVRTEIVVAVVILAKGAVLDGDAALAHCRASLAAYKVPRQVRFVAFGELPLTTTGKVHRMRLQELFVPAEAVSA